MKEAVRLLKRHKVFSHVAAILSKRSITSHEDSLYKLSRKLNIDVHLLDKLCTELFLAKKCVGYIDLLAGTVKFFPVEIPREHYGF